MGRSASVVSTNDQALAGVPLLLARLGWLAIVTFVMALWYVSMPAYLQALASPCTGSACQLDGAATADDLRLLHAAGISTQAYVIATAAVLNVAILIWLAVGVLIFLRRGHDLGVLVIALILATGNPSAANGPSAALAMGDPRWSTPVTILGFLSTFSFGMLFLLFPDGRFVPRWTKWAALLSIVDSFVTTFLPSTFPLNNPNGAGSAIQTVFTLAFAGVYLYSQIYRYRHASSSRQRAQTKWAVFGLVSALVGVIALNAVDGIASALHMPPVPQPILNMLFPFVLLCIPLSIGIAILRSRLYDIDVIIRRTLIYGSLTVILAGVYIAGVIGVQTIIDAMTPHTGATTSPVLIVITTLAIAAIFQPLRRVIQRFIDRRFYRSKYDTRKTLEAFSATLRQEVDLSALTGQLVGVVTETMQPEHISLWIREKERRPA